MSQTENFAKPKDCIFCLWGGKGITSSKDRVCEKHKQFYAEEILN